MRLLNITNRYYILIALDLLLIGNAFLAYRLLSLVDADVTKNMLREKQEIDKQLFEQKQIRNVHFRIGDGIEIQPIDKFTTFRVNMHDTDIMDLYQKRNVAYRVLSYEQRIDNDGYRIHISKRLPSRRNIIVGILMTVILTGFAGVVSFYLLNRWFARQIWKPFYSALNMLKNFDLRKNEKLSFEKSSIDEFKTMNKELARLTNKVERDYNNLKEFTENISHETQTPLAIIHSRLEVLMQSENLTMKQREQVNSTLEAVNRLSKMNKALILLAKIENNQFFETKTIRLGDLLNAQLNDLEMFINAKHLTLNCNIDTEQSLNVNEHLAEILLRNLLSNAVRYNYPNGSLVIDYHYNKLVISNTGEPFDFPASEIFERFRKGNLPESLGLGLAIVKKICDFCNCEISYSYFENIHAFSILFSQEKLVNNPDNPS